MRKVIYPGPGVEGEARLTDQHFGGLQIHLAVGENLIPDTAAKQLLELRVVEDAPGQQPIEAAAAAPPADETTTIEPDQGDTNTTGRRRRQS